MCETCGCSGDGQVRVTDLQAKTDPPPAHDHGHGHHHHHGHDHGHDHHHHHHHGHDHHHHHDHAHEPRSDKVLALNEAILAKNNKQAERNRGWFVGRGILALNLVSSPGAGKTTLLERTLRDLGGEMTFAVIEGDQETTRDAERIQATGCRVVQVNTGTGCHLDAEMVAWALARLDPPAGSVVLIENVGNLVCPALFDLGEHAKVVIASVAEGDDKPIKYPHMFRASSLMLLNKTDLLPHVPFDVDRCVGHARQVNPRIEVLNLSTLRGEGLTEWYAWLKAQQSRASQLALVE